MNNTLNYYHSNNLLFVFENKLPNVNKVNKNVMVISHSEYIQNKHASCVCPMSC